ncbi:MAG: carboxylating nicotinate-nucleotide diphosphorylase [Acidobacteriota bacterium]|nr:carboxylating nicotinate-nucleotide diphosphorylase [Acidobacteriota bacterium]
MLNLLARLSGIATTTARAVEEVSHTSCRVADTRKTTPGLRLLEKYAVAIGGGENHRLRLDTLVMIKDNHKQLAGGIRPAIEAVRAAGYDPAEIEVEVDDLEEFDEALEARAGWILLDNMEPEVVREAVQRSGGRCRLEVSGGLRIGALSEYAETGADRLSLGALTHSVCAADLALDLEDEVPAG